MTTTYPIPTVAATQPVIQLPYLDFNGFLMVLGIITIIFLVFYITRYVILWYWRINDLIDVLRAIEINLRK